MKGLGFADAKVGGLRNWVEASGFKAAGSGLLLHLKVRRIQGFEPVQGHKSCYVKGEVWRNFPF